MRVLLLIAICLVAIWLASIVKKNKEAKYYRNRKKPIIQFTRYEGDNQVRKRANRDRELLEKYGNPYDVDVHEIYWQDDKQHYEDFQTTFQIRKGQEIGQIMVGNYRKNKKQMTNESIQTLLFNQQN